MTVSEFSLIIITKLAAHIYWLVSNKIIWLFNKFHYIF